VVIPTAKPQRVDCTVESAIRQMLSRTPGPASCTKRWAMAEGRLMKKGSIQ
jgi:hypothetical protein